MQGLFYGIDFVSQVTTAQGEIIMKQAFLSIVVLFCLVLSISAQSAQSLLKNGDFEDGESGWQMVEGAEIDAHGGYNGNSGLHVWRDDPEKYSFPIQRVKLEIGRLYQLSLWTKGEGCDRATASYGVEYYSAEKKWLGGAYNIGPQESSFDWTYREVTACPPAGTDFCQVVLYLEKGGTGHVWFDNVALEPTDRNPDIFLVQPIQGLVKASGETARVRVAKLGSDRPDYFDGWKVRLTTTSADGEAVQSQAIETRNLEFALGELPAGTVTLNAELLNPDGEVINAVKHTFQAMAEALERPQGACVIDERGRAWVNGKPFLPIGLYLSDLRNPDDLVRLMDSPFNCFMPYHSIGLAVPGQQNPPYTFEKIRALLDVLQRNDKKVIFSIKDFFPTAKFQPTVNSVHKNMDQPFGEVDELVTRVVAALRDHPALLAWYVNDEISLSHVQMVNDRRDLVNGLDPWHPTWGVLCDYNEAPFFASACDVFGVDPYPLGKKAEPRTQKKVITAMEAFKASGLSACWVVPQLFNWGTYQARRKPETYPEYVEPSEEEMRTMTLLMAIRGAKGFIYYSYFDLHRPTDPSSFKPPVEAPENFYKRWDDIVRVAKLLQDLAPFLLSDHDSQPVPAEILEGQAEIRTFTDNSGQVRVLIAAIGPGPVKVRFQTEAPGLRSFYGRCTRQADGSWLFEGIDLVSDVLGN